MKKIYLCIILLVAGLCLVACSNANADAPSTERSTAETTTPETAENLEATAVPETTAAPETTATPETTAIPETTEAPETSTATETTDPPETEDPWVVANRVIPDVIPEYVQGDYIVYSPEDSMRVHPYETTFLPTYRDTYYWSPGGLYKYADPDLASQWFREVYRASIESNIEPSECYIVSFVKYCHISKEDFIEGYKLKSDRIEQWLEESLDIRTEAYEIPNADIIYTFDNEIINDYYRKDKAVYTEYVKD